MKALVLVDFEKEWVDSNSEYYVGDISDVIQRTNMLLDYCRKSGYKIIFTRHVEKDSNDAFSEKSKNIEIIDDIGFTENDILITKYKISPFYQTDLMDHLKGIDKIVVCGILTNLCVRSVVQDAYDRDFDITVIKDCCVAFDEKTQEFTFNDLKATREDVKFFNFNEFLSEN